MSHEEFTDASWLRTGDEAGDEEYEVAEEEDAEEDEDERAGEGGRSGTSSAPVSCGGDEAAVPMILADANPRRRLIYLFFVCLLLRPTLSGPRLLLIFQLQSAPERSAVRSPKEFALFAFVLVVFAQNLFVLFPRQVLHPTEFYGASARQCVPGFCLRTSLIKWKQLFLCSLMSPAWYDVKEMVVCLLCVAPDELHQITLFHKLAPSVYMYDVLSCLVACLDDALFWMRR